MKINEYFYAFFYTDNYINDRTVKYIQMILKDCSLEKYVKINIIKLY